jgi:hypothetical protein
MYRTSTPRVSGADTRRAYISVTGDEYGALLRHVYEFCGRGATGSRKLADPILHRRELPLL